MKAATVSRRTRVRTAGTAIWVLVAAVFGLSVFLANGAPLFYFDTASYLVQGSHILEVAGVSPRAVTDRGDSKSTASGSLQAASPDGLVDGSRSAVYGAWLAALDRVHSLTLVVILNLAMISLTVWLTARYMVGASPPSPTPGRLTAMALIAGCLGSLAFYIAFLMPDILAPVLILSIALLSSHGARTGTRDRGLLLVLALFAVVSHPSHLLIAATLVPAALLLSPALSGRRVWFILGLLGLLVSVGAAERLVFHLAVARLEHKSVLYLPFLTARLISDGPGLDYLDRHCPDPGIETCALWQVLQVSDDPARLDGPNILFGTDQGRGSYKLLDDATRQRVSGEQLGFLMDVVREDPWGVLGPLVRNVGAQLTYFRVDMTLPFEGQAAALKGVHGPPVADLRDGWLVSTGRSWLDPLGVIQGWLYTLSTLVVIALILMPGRISHENRILAIVVLLGILANAVVCGGVSEPANRYGARVMSLLPMLGVLLWFGAREPQPRQASP